jgi:hypothetical protein
MAYKSAFDGHTESIATGRALASLEICCFKGEKLRAVSTVCVFSEHVAFQGGA